MQVSLACHRIFYDENKQLKPEGPATLFIFFEMQISLWYNFYFHANRKFSVTFNAMKIKGNWNAFWVVIYFSVRHIKCKMFF